MKKNILLIDDNKYLLDVFVIRLTMCLHNYKILTAADGRRGIEILGTKPIEFVLTDLDMPGINGFEFIEYAKKHHPTVPVFAMTGNCTSDVLKRLQSLGIHDCIEKPFLVEEVTYRIMSRLKESLTSINIDQRLVPSNL